MASMAGSLSAGQLNDLLGIPDSRLEARVSNKVLETCMRIEYAYGKPVGIPQVKYDLKGRVAGYAMGGHTIRLNLDLLKDPRYVDSMIEDTVPHEVAHIACHQFWPRENVHHGWKWQNMMVRLGLEPNRCHQYEVKPQRVHKKFHYTCNCVGRIHKLGSARHRRAQTDKTSYYCTVCGKTLEWNGAVS